jgi:DNA mismatch endonuclease, patch repair protein
MADVFSRAKRSEVMARIRSKNTKPEVTVRKYLHAKGFRYRLHDKKLPGNPDIILKRCKTIIFVNGCFWHGHQDSSCKISRVPKSNTEFWIKKIARNKERDVKSKSALAYLGWNVITIWECELRSKKIESTLVTLVNNLAICKL